MAVISACRVPSGVRLQRLFIEFLAGCILVEINTLEPCIIDQVPYTTAAVETATRAMVEIRFIRLQESL
jgi:hypothetical protein